jgi:hypothetical protein
VSLKKLYFILAQITKKGSPLGDMASGPAIGKAWSFHPRPCRPLASARRKKRVKVCIYINLINPFKLIIKIDIRIH